MKTCIAYLQAHGAFIQKPDMIVDPKLSNIQKEIVSSDE